MSERTVTGKAVGVGEANSFGFANVKIETSSGQTEWAASKLPGIIGEARRAKEAGEVRSFDLVDKVAEKINPQTGQPYVNTYIEAIRPPAQEEVNAAGYSTGDRHSGPVNGFDNKTTAVIPGVNAQTKEDEGWLTLTQMQKTTPSPGTQDEFRRSKEEMRWTEALNIASRILPAGARTIQLGELARLVEALIQEKA